ncbi:MAG: methyltransferase domain-containing protein [Acidimicrobiia bacterium]|nr:methyltransferase domain-containing protein [Acidimicrobiia bacterium]
MAWEPDHYLRFADHRARPGVELMARIRHDDPGLVVDLGCGPGNLTALLAERWPRARVVGIDSSAEMIEAARSNHPGVEWIAADIEKWEPERPVDVLYSNATLHWLDDHATMFPRLRSWLTPSSGVVAIQMPDNWKAPTHRIPAEILDDGTWPAGAAAALMRDRLSAPEDYRRWLQPAVVDQWRTTYYQELTGPDAVWGWLTGSVLRPVLAALDADDGNRFAVQCKQRYAVAYPHDADGNVLLPFSRLFMVATG